MFWICLAFGLLMIGMYLYQESRTKMIPDGDYLDQVYNTLWTGMPDDRIYAWERVIRYLEMYRPYEPELLFEAQKRMDRMERYLSQTMAVDEEGILITKTEEI